MSMLCVLQGLLSHTLLQGWVRSEGPKLSYVVGRGGDLIWVRICSVKPLFYMKLKTTLSFWWKVCPVKHRCSFPARPRDFSLFQHVQAGSEANSASYSMSRICSFLRSKAAGAWRWPLSITCLHSVHRNSFNLIWRCMYRASYCNVCMSFLYSYSSQTYR